MIGRTFARSYATPAILLTLVLLRTPVVTADLPVFQQQYYAYQKELWKRLMWTFPKWYYYREGTLAEQKFRELNKNPVFNNPNLEFPTGRPDIKQQRDRRFKQELRLPKTYDELDELTDSMSRKIVPNLRTTEADRTNDRRSLERALARTLYLVISEDGEKSWTLPTFGTDGQPLHKAAEEGLYRMGGDELNYFNVLPTPMHVRQQPLRMDFFIKLHILSGQFKPTGDVAYVWVTKDEAAEYLDAAYYAEIRHLMSDV